MHPGRTGPVLAPESDPDDPRTEGAPGAERPITVLVLAEYFVPGYKGGGPIRTLTNLMTGVGGSIRWRVITRDHDLGETKPYPDVESDRWTSRDEAEVFYASQRSLATRHMARLLRGTGCDVIYLNSFFSARFGILPLVLRKLGLIPSVPVILAPRGEFSPGALRLKAARKRAYRFLAKVLGLHAGVRWHVSTEEEARDLRRGFSSAAVISVAPNPGAAPDRRLPPVRRRSGPPLRVVFLSRISPKKNLDGALRILKEVRCEVEFGVYGPVESREYLRKCQSLLDDLPGNVRVVMHGSLPHAEVLPTLAEYDLFFLPTLGENFGHVVLEALLAGCPLLLSDQTPWRGLQQRGIGWDLPLDRPEEFRAALEACARMSPDEHLRFSRSAREAGLHYLESSDAAQRTEQMFVDAAIGLER